MKKLYIICDYREKFSSLVSGEKIYNDHISKQSLDNLINTMIGCGYNAEYFGGVDDLIKCYHEKINMPDGIYINLNDGLTEKHKRGQTPLLLEMLKVAYSGSDAFHTLLVSDKYFTNLCLQKNNILCPGSVLISEETDLEQIYDLNTPLILKPNYEGSSIGISNQSFCQKHDQAVLLAKNMMKDYDDILVQEYISGYEITNLLILKKGTDKILFNEAMCISYNDQIFLTNEVFGINEKSSNIRQYRLANQVLDSAIVDKIKYISENIARILHLTNFIRIDYRINCENIYFIEANTNPAFGVTSDVGKCCSLLNMPFDAFVSLFIDSVITN
ncbi:MAG: ATP-grasp domain-containing protein [Erysipelotrichales bacterium]|nr:ATP-grasp domain-containing protein [Erysipelotrichales bacterium]